MVAIRDEDGVDRSEICLLGCGVFALLLFVPSVWACVQLYFLVFENFFSVGALN